MGEVFDEIAAWIGRQRMFLGRDGAERQRRGYPDERYAKVALDAVRTRR
jgi:hypothetical protein